MKPSAALSGNSQSLAGPSRVHFVNDALVPGLEFVPPVEGHGFTLAYSTAQTNVYPPGVPP